LAQSGVPRSAALSGTVRDQTGAVLPGVTVELRGSSGSGSGSIALTGSSGEYAFSNVRPGRYQVAFSLINFATVVRRDVTVSSDTTHADAVMHLTLNADVTVTGRRSFANLADAERPAEDLVGIAQSASQGAITARQLDVRPIMRTGEVLETVPGVVISQHSGEGKANQYYLRGFNLDHGTDFATTVAGIPVNLPTHAHGQGYSDLNFLIPELVSGVQFSKGPYFADQGDFATAGSANINYTNVLERPIVRAGGGGEGYARALFAASPSLADGHLLAALEIGHDDGPWARPDDYGKLNGVLRYSQGDAVNGFSVTAMGYHAKWNSTDQIPLRAVESGGINRFGAIDPSDGGSSYRYSLVGDWQRGHDASLTKITAYGLAYDLDLFSNFTFYLNDPVNGDQVEQTDQRFVSGVRVSNRRQTHWGAHAVQNTIGIQLRNDDITNIGLYHTRGRSRLDTRQQDSVLETSAAVYAQNEVEWASWLRTTLGVRGDGYRFRVAASDPFNSGARTAGLVSPKAGVVIGPWKGTELYGNTGSGYHSNDARGTTITRDADGNAVDRVTPLVRATGAEVGLRTVKVPHLQSTFALWTLRLDSELVFAGDAGTTLVSRPSRRYGVEWANYYAPLRWLILDGDVAWSRGHFTDFNAAGSHIPGSVQTVASLGVAIDDAHGVFGGARLRYFGPRPLIADNTVQSKATSLVSLEAGYKLARNLRLAVDVFNVLDAKDSDIDYYYPSRLPGEPAPGVDDIHVHPTIPRTARINLIVGF
jgi:hypothetical protein